MNLATTFSLLAGGPGSGCQGPNCGRKTLVDHEGKKYHSKIQLPRTWPKDGDARLSVTSKGKEVGYIRLEQSEPGYNRVKESLLDKDLRGRGLGRQMYQHAADFTRASGKRVLYSDNTLSDKAKRVWKAMGAKRIPDEYGTTYGLDLK